jgi:branched-chain amino acid transport system substrate-binding protein
MTESGKLREALAQTKSFPGVTGLITIDADRNAVKPAVVLKLLDASFIYETTIQPKASQSSQTEPSAVAPGK